MRSPRLPSYKACSAVLNALELLNQSTRNISMNENLLSNNQKIFSIKYEKTEQLLVLKLALLPYFTILRQMMVHDTCSRASLTRVSQVKNFCKINIDTQSLLVHFLVVIEDKVIQQRWLRKIAQKCLLAYFCTREIKEKRNKTVVFVFWSNFMRNFTRATFWEISSKL